MYLQKVTSRKNCVKKLVFCWHLDENSRIRFQDPDPDPLVRGMDPRIRIRTKNSWIRNTVSYKMFSFRSVLEALLKRGSRVIMACSDPGVATTEHTRLRHALSLSNSLILQCK
jgi:hypothetical protein